MEALSHRIRSLRWGARARSQPEAFAVRKWLRDELHATLLPAFERAFDVAASRDEVLHIPQLDLHLEVAAVDEIKDLLPDLIRRRLAELLRSRAAGAAPAQQPGGGLKTLAEGSAKQETLAVQRATAGEDRLQALARYLTTGSIPWSSASADRTVVLEQLRSAATGELAEILAALTESASRQQRFEERMASYFRLLQLFPEGQWSVLAETSAKGLAPERRNELTGVIAALTRDRLEGTSRYQRLWVTAAVLAAMEVVAADAEESAAALDLHQELVANEELFASPAATAAAILRRLEIESESDSVRSSWSEPEGIETQAPNRSDEKTSPPSQLERHSDGAREALSKSFASESVTGEPAPEPSPSEPVQRRSPLDERKTARDLSASDRAAAEDVEIPDRAKRSAAQEISHSFGDDAGSEKAGFGVSSAADGLAAEDMEVTDRAKRSGDDAGSEEPRPRISPSIRPKKRSAAGRPERVLNPISPSDTPVVESEIPEPAARRSSSSGRKTFRKPAALQDARIATGEVRGAPRLPADEPESGSGSVSPVLPARPHPNPSPKGEGLRIRLRAPSPLGEGARGEVAPAMRAPEETNAKLNHYPESRSVDESGRHQGLSAVAAKADAENERKPTRERAAARGATDDPARQREAAGFRPLLREARSSGLADTEQGIQGPGVSVFPLVVTQAGLVLLHPFLSRFFDNLGIKDAKQAVLPAASLPRAAALLHWLATGDEEVYEFELGFIKILLGLPPGFTLPVASGLLHASDREEADALLQAVLEHWTALKSTSAAALRQSFLRRSGLLREEEQGFRLQVEPEPFDVLLGTLPWGLGTVKLSWMKKPIFTDWPTL